MLLVKRRRHFAAEFADQVVVLLAAGQGFKELNDGFAAGAFIETTVTDDNFQRRFEGFAEAVLGGVGAGKIKSDGVIGRVGRQFGFKLSSVGCACRQRQAGAQGVGPIRLLNVFAGEQLAGFVVTAQLK